MTDTHTLARTPLHALHLELGAKMVPFAGYDMPVQYPAGVKQEHLHCRAQAGLFDVSHMGQIRLTGPNAAKALEALVPVDIIDLPVNKQRYALFTNDAGGILDDLMVTQLEDHLFLVVNAACKAQDIAHLRANLPNDVAMEVLEDRALIALQGPQAASVLSRFNANAASMIFMDSQMLIIDGVECLVSRSGYTGEDGYEISIPCANAEAICRQLLDQPEVEPIGLGARDSLRLESGLCLYGHDIDTDTTPVSASLNWAISKIRRSDGERAGGFPGDNKILEQLGGAQFPRKRVGLIGQGRAPVREGTVLVDSDNNEIGTITSGTFGPSVGRPVAMGYIDSAFAGLETEVFALVRGKSLPMNVAKMPFVPQRYYRG